MYKLIFKKSLKKDIKKIPKKDLERIAEDIKNLKINPLPRGVKKIKKKGYYRIRQGAFRIGYTINPLRKEITIVFIRRRTKGTYC
ncbi:MAG: type II toxin-antitoxin system RelE/ParE family toxin [Elusimicrobia bacterium]|nr:type II toxin-antitoxin system RelE/ParE family toxin [Elusimicrobiota bacterium]